jgi:hypothetical protein
MKCRKCGTECQLLLTDMVHRLKMWKCSNNNCGLGKQIEYLVDLPTMILLHGRRGHMPGRGGGFQHMNSGRGRSSR